MTNELILKAKECKSAEELLALAKENGIEMTAEEAAEKFTALNNVGELSDDELENAAGGGCATHGIAMPDRFPKVGQVFTVKGRIMDVQWECSKCGSIYYRCTSLEEWTDKTRIHASCKNCGATEYFWSSSADRFEFIVVLG